MSSGGWTGDYSGKIQFHDNRLYFQSGSNGWNLRNSSGTSIIDITGVGAISGQPLTLAQNLTLNNVTTIGVGRDLRFSQGNWTGEVAGKIQFHSNNLYFQGGTGGHYFRNPSGTNVLIFDVDGHISSNNSSIQFDTDVLINGGANGLQIGQNSDIRFETGNWTGEANNGKIQCHGGLLYIQGGSHANYSISFRDNGGSDRAYFDQNGHFHPSATNQYDLGTSSYRWRNVYTTDLQLSNKGKTNDVDGTWGDYTIQEGEHDLFLINNRSGKKFKFNLTEV